MGEGSKEMGGGCEDETGSEGRSGGVWGAEGGGSGGQGLRVRTCHTRSLPAGDMPQL